MRTHNATLLICRAHRFQRIIFTQTHTCAAYHYNYVQKFPQWQTHFNRSIEVRSLIDRANFHRIYRFSAHSQSIHYVSFVSMKMFAMFQSGLELTWNGIKIAYRMHKESDVLCVCVIVISAKMQIKCQYHSNVSSALSEMQHLNIAVGLN